MPSLKKGSVGVFDKPEQFQTYHTSLAGTLADRSEHVYAAVGYTPAQEYGLSPHQTGRGGVGEQGTVFSGATTMDGTPLTARQKDIIAAHEAYHGMVKASGALVEDTGLDNSMSVMFRIVPLEPS